ncbi:MAG: hypothetical protein SGI73_03680 [Chloroflexota bacterium]|nr:hypothetical protein [Chloroflexota bacterium]
MGIAVQWDDDAHTIARMDFDGKWTWTDLKNANDQMGTMIASVDHPVAVITDVTRSNHLPEGALSEARSISGGLRGQVAGGLIVAVRASTLVKSLFPIFFNVYGKRAGFPMTYFVDTLDDARALIREKRNPLF